MLIQRKVILLHVNTKVIFGCCNVCKCTLKQDFDKFPCSAVVVSIYTLKYVELQEGFC